MQVQTNTQTGSRIILKRGASLNLPLKFNTGPHTEWILLPSALYSNTPCMAPFSGVQSLLGAIKTLKRLESFQAIYPMNQYSRQPFFQVTMQPGYFNVTPLLVKEIRALLFLNLKCRVLFRQLLTAWLLKRKMKAVNTEDLLTLEAPKKPVYLYEWPTRSIFVFESKTILKDCAERLLMHDELWVNSQYPRNPYTNRTLTIGQMHSVYTQIMEYGAYGKFHTPLSALRAVEYNHPQYIKQYALPLQYYALNRLFSNTSSTDYIEIMIEFMATEHDQHDREFNAALYRWALTVIPDCELLLKWRRICRKYHELNFTILDARELRKHLSIHIDPITEGLCGPPTVLLAARDLWLRQQRALKQKAKE